MHKPAPLTCTLAILLLLSFAGSVNIPTSSASDQSSSLQGICRAPSAWIYSTLDSLPVFRQVPKAISQEEKNLEARMPRLASLLHRLPVGKGSLVEGWILKTSPRYM